MEHKHELAMDPAQAAGALARDPVCGMSVNPATAKHKSEHDGKTVFFCSGRCREKFEADPASYLSTPPDSRTAAAHDCGCGGHARAHAPAPTQPAPEGSVYTCPMHPEIRQDH